MGVGKILTPISISLGQGHQATEAGQDLSCPHDRARNAHPITTKHGRYYSLVMRSTWLSFGGILSERFLANFYVEFKICFSLIEHSICHILRMIDPIDGKQKGNESTGCYAD